MNASMTTFGSTIAKMLMLLHPALGITELKGTMETDQHIWN